MINYECSECGESHSEIPTAYRLEFPPNSYDPDSVRFGKDGELCSAGSDRFITANIELPIAETSGEKFIWTCWFSLSHASYDRLIASWETTERENQEPAFGYLSNVLPTYDPSTYALKALVHVRPLGLRPWVELEPTDHPLAQEQTMGILSKRILNIFHTLDFSYESEL